MTTDTAEASAAPVAPVTARAHGGRAGRRTARPAGARTSFLRHPMTGQLARFAGVGVASTVAFGVLYLALRPMLGAFAANAAALLITAVANTAVNRRVTFGVRGGAGLAGDHVVGLLAFGAGLVLTTGSLAVLHVAGSSSKGIELAVLTLANALATLLRFVVLRLRIHRA